jgi:hypothetical protein
MPDPIDVLLVCDLAPLVDRRLAAEYRVHRAAPGDTIAPDIAAKIRVVIAGGVAPDKLLTQLPRLEIVGNAGVGYDGMTASASRPAWNGRLRSPTPRTSSMTMSPTWPSP